MLFALTWRLLASFFTQLRNSWTGTEVIRNGAHLINDLKRFGEFELLLGDGIMPEPEKLLRFPNSMGTRLFMFDDRGLRQKKRDQN